MKRYLLIMVIFIFIGCARTIPFEPVAHPDKRIKFEGLSFLPPNGENWEMMSQPLTANLAHEEFGRSTLKFMRFRKTVIGQNQAPETAETIWAEVVNQKFAVMDFDHADELKSLVRSRYKISKNLGEFVLESNAVDMNFKEMNCIKDDTKMQYGRKVSGSAIAFIRYVQEYACIHPKNSKQVIELRAGQELPKGQTPTNIQSELDHFLNSLEVDGLP